MRAILFGLLARGETVIWNYLPSPDTKLMIEACCSLGAKVEIDSQKIKINGVAGIPRVNNAVIDVGNSGIALRFVTAVAALSSQSVTFIGDHSICTNRPLQPLLDGLSQLGVTVKTLQKNGYAPVNVKGPLASGKATIAGEDSQPVSALLIAGAFAPGPIELNVINPGEKPWVVMTLAWLDRLGIAYQAHDFKRYNIPGNQQFEGFEYHVPGDLSTAAFPIAAAVITQSELTVHNVDMSDCQGDKAFIHILIAMGAYIEIEPKKNLLQVKKSGRPLIGRTIDVNDFIDSIAILAVIGCLSEGETHLINAANARTKECDRIHCLATELQKMGADINENPDGLSIRHSKLRGAKLCTYSDHRVAMALTVAALVAEGDSYIDDIKCIAKTYPSFLQDFNSIGAQIVSAHNLNLWQKVSSI